MGIHKRILLLAVLVLLGFCLILWLPHETDRSIRIPPPAQQTLRWVVFDHLTGRVQVDGREAPQSANIELENGQVFVPLGVLSRAFDFDADWDDRSLDLTVRTSKADLRLNSRMNRAWIDDVPVSFSDIARGSDNAVLLKLDVVADVFGLHAHYNLNRDQALIATASYPYMRGSNEDDPRRVPVFFEHYVAFPLLEPTEERVGVRKLIFSDSPEVFHNLGILYEDTGLGAFRLYVTHVNGLKTTAQLRVVVTNHNDQPVTITTTHRGEPPPSKDYSRLGVQALAEWFSGVKTDDQLVIPPHQSKIYYQSEPLAFMDGVHFIDDLEMDGELQFDFLATNPDAGGEPPASLEKLPTDIHDRGTFDVSTINIELDAITLDGKPGRIRIGDNGSRSKQWVTGVDAISGQEVNNYGNYGVFYNVHVRTPGRTAFVLVPIRGYYRGVVLFDNKVVEVPGIDIGESYLVGRTSGNEESVELVICPPSGSYVPFELLVYPLDAPER